MPTQKREWEEIDVCFSMTVGHEGKGDGVMHNIYLMDRPTTPAPLRTRSNARGATEGGGTSNKSRTRERRRARKSDNKTRSWMQRARKELKRVG